jgi:hypothetical protein
MKSSSLWRSSRRIASLVLLGFAAACSDDSTEPGDGLTSTQRDNLKDLFSEEVVVQAFFGENALSGSDFFLPLIAQNLQKAGTVSLGSSANSLAMNRIPLGIRQVVTPTGTYHTFAGQLILTVVNDGEDDIELVWTGVFGVNSLDNPTSLFIMGAVDNGTTTPPTEISPTQVGVDGNRVVMGGFVQFNGSAAPTLYRATDGHFALTGSSYSGSANCSGIALYTFINPCSRSEGEAEGSFSMSGPATEGGETISIPNTEFDLPALRMTMTVDVSNF